MSSTPDNPPTDETKMSQVVPSLDTGSNQNGPQDPTDEESQSLGDGAAKKDDSTAKKDDPTAKMPTTDDAIKEQMVVSRSQPQYPPRRDAAVYFVETG